MNSNYKHFDSAQTDSAKNSTFSIRGVSLSGVEDFCRIIKEVLKNFKYF